MSRAADPVALLAEQVAAHAPVGAREERAREDFLAALARLPRPLDETADPVHVTASAVVVGPRGVLLHRHKRLGIWMQPGGHVDAGERPPDAAVRETLEETGLSCRHADVPVPDQGRSPAGVAGDPPIFHVDVHPGGRGHTHLDVRYLLVAPDAPPEPGRGESPAVRWCSLDEARGLADEGLIAALQRPRLTALLAGLHAL